jgi:AcrR family transcriptional regulator
MHAVPQPPDTRTRLHRAATHLISREGPGASVRAIARHAGVTEGALYRHYDSREDLLGAVFAELIEPMVTEKQMLVEMRAPIRDRLREWIRCTYARFDTDPDAFAYVFLTDHDFPRQYARLAGLQRSMLRSLLVQARNEGLLGSLSEDLAATLFVGLLLSVPEGIRAGKLPKPALQYVDHVAQAVWCTLNPPIDTPADPPS